MPFPLDESYRESIAHNFRKKNLVWDEDYFLGVLQSSTSSKWDVVYAVIALRDCGTPRSIPALKDKLSYPMQDVKCTSILTIAHIAGESETPFYADLLLDPAYRENGYAIWAIADAADMRAVDAVLAYFARNKNKLNKGKLHTSTVSKGLQYLQKFIDQDLRIAEFFSEVLQCLPKILEKAYVPTDIAFLRKFASDHQATL